MKVYISRLVDEFYDWVELFTCEKTDKESIISKLTNELAIPIQNAEWRCEELGNELFVFMCPYAAVIGNQGEIAVIHSSKEDADNDYMGRQSDI